MKRLLIVVLSIFLLTGCAIGVSQTQYQEVVDERDAALTRVDELEAKLRATPTPSPSPTPSPTPEPVKSYGIAIDKGGGVTIYSEPSRSSEIVGTAQDCAPLVALDEQAVKGWIRLEYKNQVAYIEERCFAYNGSLGALKAQFERQKDQYKTYTYKEIARDPSSYKGKQAVFTGEVMQVADEISLGGSLTKVYLLVQITKAKYYYSDPIYVVYTRDAYESRVLESDIVKVYGKLDGLYTYKTIAGSTNTIPQLDAIHIELK